MRLFLVILFLQLLGSSTARILNGYCSDSSEKCGFLDFGFLMHKGQPGASGCIEICAFVPLVRFGFECGSCSNIPVVPAPKTPSPTEPQIATPAPTPKEVCSADRCVFGLGFAMHQGVQDTTACVEICTFNPVLREGFLCGYCNSEGSLPPSPSPTTLSPTESPTIGPTERPTRSNQPSLVPTITAMPVDSVGFDIQLEFGDAVDNDDKALFINAVNRWESLIVGDLTDVQRGEIDDAPPDGCEYPRLIDDLLICAFLGPLDGPGNVAGLARPLFVRGTDDNLGLPVTGEMLFDSEDAAAVRNAGILQDLITHEMGHVLDCCGQKEARQNPHQANRVLILALSLQQNTIPLADALEQLHRLSSRTQTHWAENCLENELMTGALEIGESMPLSRITVASFADIGYDVSYDDVDPFGTADLNPACVCRRRGLAAGDAVLLANDETNGSSVRRRLSDELRQEAITYGLSVLEASATKYAAASVTQERVDQTTTFVGDRAVSVLVRDGDSFFGVLVTREMAFNRS